MFGYVVGNTEAMDSASAARYHAAYCGLCREIGRRSGELPRLSLTYDLVFLLLLLSSLYEPEEHAGVGRCVVHPAKREAYFTNRFTAYAADMNVYLAYYKSLDDWDDEHKGLSRAFAARLAKPCAAIDAAWPRQCARVRAELAALREAEKAQSGPDAAANAFGELMGELFVYDEREHWAPVLRAFGQGLGRFIYMLDAALDYEKDKKSGAYNPLLQMDKQPAQLRGALTLLIGEAAAAFETLPLERDLPILRNILYGGIWQKYNAAFAEKTGASDIPEEPGLAGKPDNKPDKEKEA